MIIDGTIKLSDAQEVTATAPSTNVWDRGDKSGRLYNPRTCLFVQVVKAGAGAAATPASGEGSEAGATAAVEATIQAVVQVSDDGSAWTSKIVGSEYTVADAVAGTMLINGQPILLDIDERFIRINYVVGGTISVAPKVSAFFAPDGTPHQKFNV